MALEDDEGKAAEAVEDVVVDPVEVVEPVEKVEDEPAKDEVVDGEVDPDKKEDEADKDEPAKDAEPEVITFDDADTLETRTEKTEKILAKYDLSEVPEVQAAIDAWKAAAEAVPVSTESPVIAELADYGEPEAIKMSLERDNLLTSVREVESGQFRPNTDKYAAELTPDTANWLYFDLAKLPSTKYQGLNQFEEGICDALGRENDTIGTVLDRYNKAMEYAKTPTMLETDIPTFIPQNVREAYQSLSKAERAELDAFAPENDRVGEYDDNGKLIDDAKIRADKLTTLAKIQKGIEADRQTTQTTLQTKEQKQQEFSRDVVTKQITFFDQMRDTFTENIIKDVIFSTDPKMQNLLARQQVTTLTQAFLDDSDGVYARKALEDSGIKFDYATAQSLVKDIETASVSLTIAQKMVDANGKQLNEVALKKATREFADAGRKWQDFAEDILTQEKQLTSTGKAEEIKKEVEKIKVAPKARPTAKGAASPSKQDTDGPPSHIPYGTPEWDKWYAKQTLAEREARKALAYQ